VEPWPDNAPEIAERLLSELRDRANTENVAGMARFGISSAGTLGVSMVDVRALARDAKRALGRDKPAQHQLAGLLWSSGVHEARIMATVLEPPTLMTRELADSWVLDIDSWDTCDQLCGNCLWATSFAWELPAAWTARPETFVKRAGFVMIVQLNHKLKDSTDEAFVPFLEMIVREATDERNDVKKGANWALRQIGKRTARGNAMAVEIAKRILDLYPDSRSARWIARDALRELGSDAVRRRLGLAEQS
jgi:3-methyladenine DNA glycosylase AlkD